MTSRRKTSLLINSLKQKTKKFMKKSFSLIAAYATPETIIALAILTSKIGKGTSQSTTNPTVKFLLPGSPLPAEYRNKTDILVIGMAGSEFDRKASVENTTLAKIVCKTLGIAESPEIKEFMVLTEKTIQVQREMSELETVFNTVTAAKTVLEKTTSILNNLTEVFTTGKKEAVRAKEETIEVEAFGDIKVTTIESDSLVATDFALAKNGMNSDVVIQKTAWGGTLVSCKPNRKQFLDVVSKNINHPQYGFGGSVVRTDQKKTQILLTESSFGDKIAEAVLSTENTFDVIKNITESYSRETSLSLN